MPDDNFKDIPNEEVLNRLVGGLARVLNGETPREDWGAHGILLEVAPLIQAGKDVEKRRTQAADMVEIKTVTMAALAANIQKGVADCDSEGLAQMADFLTQQFRELTRIANEREAYQMQVDLCDQLLKREVSDA